MKTIDPKANVNLIPYAKRPKAVLGKLLSHDHSGVEFKAIAAAGGEFGASFLVWDGEGWGELFCGTQGSRPLTKQLAAHLEDALPVMLANGRAVRCGVEVARPSDEEINSKVARFLA